MQERGAVAGDAAPERVPDSRHDEAGDALQPELSAVAGDVVLKHAGHHLGGIKLVEQLQAVRPLEDLSEV